MRTIVTTFALAVLLALPSAVLAQANFTGTWVLDPARSQGLPPEIQMTMTVKHAGDTVEIETKIVSPMGEQTIPDVYVLTGQEVDYKAPVIGAGTGKGKRTSQWSADKQGFESKESATLQSEEGEATLSATRKWTLSEDGKTLTMDVTMKGPQGEQTTKRVFTKK